ncbi:hypothetical protein HPB48_013796 [Haemaphysalis longicornis]|uniref:ABC-2 type transporter transmembrane domain-containing protein n=1 Tax=Haemaphysalis longicornis TaxID=44386 RepID=A0A9J6GZJ8_HAELO|nr:hypothetical protein HPB48_013796 [Haemaphysalis longicornis]
MREQRNCWYSLKVHYLANYVAEIPFLGVRFRFASREVQQQTAVFTAIPAVSPFFHFSGFFAQAHLVSPYFRWITHASYIFYGYNGLLLTVYGYDRAPLKCDELVCVYEESGRLPQVHRHSGDEVARVGCRTFRLRAVLPSAGFRLAEVQIE